MDMEAEREIELAIVASDMTAPSERDEDKESSLASCGQLKHMEAFTLKSLGASGQTSKGKIGSNHVVKTSDAENEITYACAMQGLLKATGNKLLFQLPTKTIGDKNFQDRCAVCAKSFKEGESVLSQGSYQKSARVAHKHKISATVISTQDFIILEFESEFAKENKVPVPNEFELFAANFGTELKKKDRKRNSGRGKSVKDPLASDGEESDSQDQKSGPYACQHPDCTKTFLDKESMTSHFRRHSGKPYACQICGKRYHLKRLLKQHLWSHSGQKPFSCPMCGVSFDHSQKLSRHMRCHTGERPFQCHLCDRSFVRKENLASHMRIHTGEKPYRCEQCGKTFSIYQSLNMHKMYQHSEEYQHVCSVCDRSFKTKYQLSLHQKIHFEEKHFQCEFCGKRFMYKHNLEQHVMLHTNSHPFKCETCGRGFVSEQQLEKHAKSHGGTRPFQCHTCKESFLFQNQYQRHLKHHDEKEQCPVCNVFFKSRLLLEKHMQKHDRTGVGGASNECPKCKKVLSTTDSLLCHLHRIHGEPAPSFPCTFCGKVFAKEHKLHSHLQKEHLSLVPDQGSVALQTDHREEGEEFPTEAEFQVVIEQHPEVMFEDQVANVIIPEQVVGAASGQITLSEEQQQLITTVETMETQQALGTDAFTTTYILSYPYGYE